MDEIKGEFKIWNGTCVQANVLVSWRQADRHKRGHRANKISLQARCACTTRYSTAALPRDHRRLKLAAGPAPTNHTVMLH